MPRSQGPDPYDTGATPRPGIGVDGSGAAGPFGGGLRDPHRFGDAGPGPEPYPFPTADAFRSGAGGDARRGELPYFSPDTGSGPQGPGGGRGGPAGPTGGPVTGDGALTPPGARGPQGAQGGPTPPRMSDDTAILTPQKPAPPPGAGAGVPGPGDNVSGHTLTSGIPVVPSLSHNSPFGAEPQAEEHVPHTPPKLPEPLQSDVPRSRPPKKGRNKLVLAGVGVVGLAGVAYGAGLLMNHSDVPKGTTVLGVDIGGGTRDEAIKKLDAALGDRVGRPLPLAVGDDTVALKPDQAGLGFDKVATVAAAAGSDYNPVSVIGSLFGGERVVEPTMPVDGEKLRSALEEAAGGAGSASDGTIRFVPGSAVAVYGKAGKGIDVDRSTTSVEEAYRSQVATGRTTPVQLPVTTRQPTVSKAEVDRVMKEFAEPAMSGIVTIKAGNASIPFGPEKSLPQILGVKAIDGKLVETYDQAALKRLYGNVFDGVLITRATGEKTPVTPQDVAGAMRKALRGTTPAERVGVIDTNPT